MLYRLWGCWAAPSSREIFLISLTLAVSSSGLLAASLLFRFSFPYHFRRVKIKEKTWTCRWSYQSIWIVTKDGGEKLKEKNKRYELIFFLLQFSSSLLIKVDGRHLTGAVVVLYPPRVRRKQPISIISIIIIIEKKVFDLNRRCCRVIVWRWRSCRISSPLFVW